MLRNVVNWVSILIDVWNEVGIVSNCEGVMY